MLDQLKDQRLEIVTYLHVLIISNTLRSVPVHLTKWPTHLTRSLHTLALPIPWLVVPIFIITIDLCTNLDIGDKVDCMTIKLTSCYQPSRNGNTVVMSRSEKRTLPGFCGLGLRERVWEILPVCYLNDSLTCQWLSGQQARLWDVMRWTNAHANLCHASLSPDSPSPRSLDPILIALGRSQS